MLGIHSCIVLGATNDGKDMFILEKAGVGDPASVRKLSEVLDREMGRYSENLTLNILRQPIARMVDRNATQP